MAQQSSIRYDFDSIIDRTGTGSLKWDRYAGKDVLPLWVADMDFRSAPEIVEALRKRVEHGVYGYTISHEAPVDAVVDYYARTHGYAIDRDWLLWLPGVVPALNLVVRAYSEPGEAVLTCTPVYAPFLSAPKWQGRELITSDLMLDAQGRWTFDFEDMERKVTPATRVFILCSPHNPVGRVFDREELLALAAFCEKHDLVLISDEIHCDLLLGDARHTVTASLGESVASRTVTLGSPSKTYNLPGLSCAHALIPNPKLRARFQLAARGLVTEINTFGYTGCVAAYTQGEPWRQALLAYLTANRDFLYSFIAEHLGEISLYPMQATYLAWLNVEKLKARGVDNPQAFFVEHGVGLSAGGDYGDARYIRLNFGCPRQILAAALERMQKAVRTLG